MIRKYFQMPPIGENFEPVFDSQTFSQMIPPSCYAVIKHPSDVSQSAQSNNLHIAIKWILQLCNLGIKISHWFFARFQLRQFQCHMFNYIICDELFLCFQKYYYKNVLNSRNHLKLPNYAIHQNPFPRTKPNCLQQALKAEQLLSPANLFPLCSSFVWHITKKIIQVLETQQVGI